MIFFKKHELFPLIAPYLPESPTIIEAGAFNGSDTKRIAAFWSHATIHAFEPVSDIFELLQKNTAHLPSVTTHNYALSSSTGHTSFHVSEKPSRPGQPFQAGSLHAPQERLAWSDARYPHQIVVATSTLDDFAKKQGIDHIDFMWLDAQGHELEILKGASRDLLSSVRVIYCEVHFIQAYAGQPLYAEVKQWLEERGFVQIAQDFTNESDWFFGNIVCVNRNKVVSL